MRIRTLAGVFAATLGLAACGGEQTPEDQAHEAWTTFVEALNDGDAGEACSVIASTYGNDTGIGEEFGVTTEGTDCEAVVSAVIDDSDSIPTDTEFTDFIEQGEQPPGEVAEATTSETDPDFLLEDGEWKIYGSACAGC